MEDGRRVALTIRGLDKDGGDVRFDDFIQQLDLLKKALAETQKLYTDRAQSYFKVVELRHESPAYIAVEPAADKPDQLEIGVFTVNKFFNSLEEIERGEYPDRFTYDTFEAYKNLTSLRDKNRLEELVISQNGSVPLGLEKVSENIDAIVGDDRFEIGSYEGMLDAINIHAGQNAFYLYPTSNLPKLRCRFPTALKDEAIDAVGNYVSVFGEKRYKPNLKDYIPYEMAVASIEVFPPEKSLPKLSGLRGIAPDATGDEKSEDFIKGLRDAW